MILAVRYKTEVNVPVDQDRVYTFWFRTNRNVFKNNEIGPLLINEYPLGSLNEGFGYDTILDGTGGGTAGIKMNLQYGDTNGDNIYVTKGFEVLVNGTSYVFNENYLEPWPNNTFPNLVQDAKQLQNTRVVDSRKWYAGVLNVSNEHQTINLNIWEMQFDASKPAYVQQTTQLKLIFGETKEFTKQEIKPGAFYELHGSPLEITNIRLLTELINEENQPLMLNRYTVRDNQYARMIDNALPPLNMTREPVR